MQDLFSKENYAVKAIDKQFLNSNDGGMVILSLDVSFRKHLNQKFKLWKNCPKLKIISSLF